jgi:dihydrofolate synthase/folylpolyglutamate synthase
MALSDAILTRLLSLHPKIIDLSLDRMWRLLELLGHPERAVPPVIHVAGTNGKGSTVAYLRAVMEAAGLAVHTYTSPHLVRFHERIRLAGDLISEPELTRLLEECEAVNGGEPITFFEITTAAAFLAFARTPADYLILEVGLGGRLDATNVIAAPPVSVITTVDYDHQQYLGTTLTEIAHEKAGILKPGCPAVIAAQPDEALQEIERVAESVGAPLTIANRDWQSYAQHGRLVFQDAGGLLDLPLPRLVGGHQIDNAGNAIAALRRLDDRRVGESHIARGLEDVSWPARMQRLGSGALRRLVPGDAELWLDGGHNPSAGRVLGQALTDLARLDPRPLVLVWGMLNTKDAAAFIGAFSALAPLVISLAVPGEENAVPAAVLAGAARRAGLQAETAPDPQTALELAGKAASRPRILICGSLYLAGWILAAHQEVAAPAVTGTTRR